MVTVWLDDLFTLVWWWALWTLADSYLIKFTPTSELFVIFVCFVWWASPRLPLLLARGQQSVESGLQKVTMTGDVV